MTTTPRPSKVVILLATYNGARFLPEQLQSIQRQTHDDWVLLVSDDGSSDDTLSIVQDAGNTDPRVRLVSSPPGKGAKDNFAWLISCGLAVNADYYFFCDQDDVWLNDKVSRQLEELAQLPSDRPGLVYHDCLVVDQQRHPLHGSFQALLKLNGRSSNLDNLLRRNAIPGCTLACNRALLEAAHPVPQEAIMHDWWLALVCAALGNIRYLQQPLLEYRQHFANVIGARTFWSSLFTINPWRVWRKGNEEFLATTAQARTLFTRLASRYGTPQQRLKSIEHYATLLEHPRASRLQLAKRQGFLNQHWFLNAMTIMRLILL